MLENLANPWWMFVILGVCAGIISGGLGVGAGALVVPALVLIFSFAQKSAQGMALAVMVPVALLGAFRYWKNPDIPIDLAVVLLIVCGAMAGTVVGTEIASRLPAHTLRKLFAVLLIVVAVRMLITNKNKGSAPTEIQPAAELSDSHGKEPQEPTPKERNL